MKLIRNVFDNVRDSAIKKLGLSSANQRLDSTLIISNIRIRGRLALFSNTLSLFLKSLDETQFSRVPKAIQDWHATESEGWFGLGPAEQKIKLQELAQYLYELILLFEKDLAASEPYQLLKRLFSEQCEFSSDEQSSKVQVKKKSEGATLQSPYDPDASYGHKGAGYSLHISETCNNAKTEIITDYEVHGAARSDIGKALSVVERLDAAGCKPETLFADGGYPSVPSALKIIEQDIEFIAPVTRTGWATTSWAETFSNSTQRALQLKCPMGHHPIDHRILSAHNTTGRSLHAIFDGDSVDRARCSIAVPCGLPTIASKAAEPAIRSEIFAWRSLPSFACGIRCTPSSRRLNGRTGIRYAQGSKRRTPN